MILNDLLLRTPQNCYIEFPDWPHYSPRKPKNNDDYWVPAVPPYQPYQDKRLDGFNQLMKLLNEKTSDWFTKDKNYLNFRLELAGYAKEDVSVTISGTTLKVSSAKNSYNNQFEIPDADNYDLTKPLAKMANGLLEISFSAKKADKTEVKIL